MFLLKARRLTGGFDGALFRERTGLDPELIRERSELATTPTAFARANTAPDS